MARPKAAPAADLIPEPAADHSAPACVVVEPLRHDGIAYAPGALAPTLDPATLTALLAAGVILPEKIHAPD